MLNFNKKFILSIFTVIISGIVSIPLIANALISYNDPNGDGDILLNDGILINQYLSGSVDVTNLERMDFDNDNIISKADAYEIQLYNLGLLNSGSINLPSASTYNGFSCACYHVFDASTGAHVNNPLLEDGYEYCLSNFNSIYNNNTAPDVTDIVIGSDSRVPNWDKSGVVKIISNNDPNGVTGFVVAPHIIATAAHCVYDSDNTSDEVGYIITDILLFDNDGDISLSATPVECHVPMSYIDFTQNYPRLYSDKYDYALITVEEDLSDYMCFNLGVALNSAVIDYVPIYNAGFPHYYNGYAVNTGLLHQMYIGTGTLIEWNEYLNYNQYESYYSYYNLDPDRQLYYNADTSEGNSGGPVYVKKDVYDKNGNNHREYYDVIAIHVSHTNNYNIGTRINGELIRFYLENDNVRFYIPE